MDIFEITDLINEHHKELSDKNISVVMSVVDGDKGARISIVGNLLGQLRGLAANLIAVKRAFVRNFPEKEWDEVWNRIMAEQALIFVLNKKLEDKDHE